MRRPAVFFDRDNTLIIGNDYLGDPAGVTLVAGAAGAVALCRDLGFAVVVVSNQSGVARGMFSEDDVRRVNARMDELLLQHNSNAIIDRHEYCPHHPQGTAAGYAIDCDCRKPKPGMILQAAEAMALDLPASWLVGDAPRDITAGQAAGCRTILIIDPTLPPSPAAAHAVDTPADFVVGSLIEAADVIRQETNRPAAALADDPRDATEERPADASSGPAGMIGPETQVGAEEMPIEVTPVGPAAEFVAAPFVAPPALDRALPTIEPEKPAESPVGRADLARLEMLNQQILMELKKFNDVRHDDFSISKLIAGITQTLALAALPIAYVLYRQDAAVFLEWLMTAIFLQVFTISLLVMGRQR